MVRTVRVGQRVADRHGNQGVIVSLKSHVAEVLWYSGNQSKVTIDTLRKPANSHRARMVSIVLGIAAALLVILAIGGLFPR